LAERRRLLVALVLDGAVAAEIDGLRRALDSRDLSRIAPHVTLVPPLNVPVAADEAVEEHLRAVARRFSPLHLTLGPPASFPPGVLYLAVGARPDELAELAGALASGPFAPPAGRAPRPFVAHVTLRSGAPAELVSAGERLLAPYATTARVEALTLLEQHVDAAHHPWRRVGEVRLGRPAVTGRGGRELEFHVTHVPAGGTDEPGERLAVSVTEAGRGVARAVLLAAGGALLVTGLEVAEEHRGEGVGGQLLGFLERLAAERAGAELVVVDARSPQFLARHGFHPDRSGLFRRGESPSATTAPAGGGDRA